MSFCTRCGTPLGDERFCTGCGAEIAPTPTPAVAAVSAPWSHADRTTYSAPVGGRGVTPLAVIAVVLFLLLMAMGGWLLLGGADEPEAKGITSDTSAAGRSPESPTLPTPTVTVTATPTPVAVPRVCWDGSEAPRVGTCEHASEGAARAAFGLTGADCTYSGLGAGHAGAVNMECGDLHVAIYEDAAARERRLAGYGLGRGGCENYADGIVFCGPDKDGRHVRTYARATGILLYVSSLRRDSVGGVAQMPADLLLHGHPGE